MSHQLIGFVSLLVAAAVMMHNGGVRLWITASVCVCGLAGALAFAVPAAQGSASAPTVLEGYRGKTQAPRGPAPVFEGYWDPMDPARVRQGQG